MRSIMRILSRKQMIHVFPTSKLLYATQLYDIRVSSYWIWPLRYKQKSHVQVINILI
jgi:hypothetical protein